MGCTCVKEKQPAPGVTDINDLVSLFGVKDPASCQIEFGPDENFNLVSSAYGPAIVFRKPKECLSLPSEPFGTFLGELATRAISYNCSKHQDVYPLVVRSPIGSTNKFQYEIPLGQMHHIWETLSHIRVGYIQLTWKVTSCAIHKDVSSSRCQSWLVFHPEIGMVSWHDCGLHVPCEAPLLPSIGDLDQHAYRTLHIILEHDKVQKNKRLAPVTSTPRTSPYHNRSIGSFDLFGSATVVMQAGWSTYIRMTPEVAAGLAQGFKDFTSGPAHAQTAQTILNMKKSISKRSQYRHPARSFGLPDGSDRDLGCGHVASSLFTDTSMDTQSTLNTNTTHGFYPQSSLQPFAERSSTNSTGGTSALKSLFKNVTAADGDSQKFKKKVVAFQTPGSELDRSIYRPTGSDDMDNDSNRDLDEPLPLSTSASFQFALSKSASSEPSTVSSCSSQRRKQITLAAYVPPSPSGPQQLPPSAAAAQDDLQQLQALNQAWKA